VACSEYLILIYKMVACGNVMHDIKIPPAVFAARANRGNFHRIPLQSATPADLKQAAREMRDVSFNFNDAFKAFAGVFGFGLRGSPKRIILRRR